MNKPGWAPVKLPLKITQRSRAIYCSSQTGPVFGTGNDLYLRGAGSTAYVGGSYVIPSFSCIYEGDTSFANTFLAGAYSFTPDETEIFYETNKK